MSDLWEILEGFKHGDPEVLPGTTELHLAVHRPDLDGHACEIVGKIHCPENHFITIHRIDHPDKGRWTRKFIADRKLAGTTCKLWYADIAPEPHECALLAENKGLFEELIVLDHHKSTGKYADKFDFVHYNGNVECGAFMLLHFLVKEYDVDPMPELEHFLCAVDAWDRWQEDSEFRERGDKLNELRRFMGPDKFVRMFSTDPAADRDPDVRVSLDSLMRHMIQERDAKIEKTLKNYETMLPREDRHGRSFLLMPGVAAGSATQNAVLKMREDVDFTAMYFANGGMELRAKKGGVDVSELAVFFGGGGHQAAAGFKIPMEMVFDFVSKIVFGG
jgi:oligoribonuclease NrnB/cAMP/cGMP phosphodiesterase (DHH superfamily)